MPTLSQGTYTRMDQSTAEDWAAFLARRPERRDSLPNRLMTMLEQLGDQFDGSPIDAYAHSLQSATLAYEDGADDETVFAALFHDVGQLASEENHSQVSAAILKPYLSERMHWIIEHHGLFQGYYYFHLIGADRYAREAYRDAPHYQACIEWCDRYDQRAFRRDYPTKPLEFFEPMVRRIIAGDPASVAAPTAGSTQ